MMGKKIDTVVVVVYPERLVDSLPRHRLLEHFPLAKQIGVMIIYNLRVPTFTAKLRSFIIPAEWTMGNRTIS
jgi:hypothetical protein